MKKYCSYLATFSLVLSCRYIDKSEYTREEEAGYYTHNPHQLPEYRPEEFQAMILEKSPDAIPNFRKKLEDSVPKWSTSGTEKKPYEIWNNFREETIEPILKELEAEGWDTTPLKNYYDRFGNLFRSPTEANEKEMIEAFKKLQANGKLEQAFKDCIAKRYHKPESLYLTESTLSYQELLYFILNKSGNTLHLKLKKAQSNLKKWKEDGHPTGLELWESISQQEGGKLNDASPLFNYPENQAAIKESLKLADQLADAPYSLTYRDFQERLPHGLKKLNDILYEMPSKETGDIQSLKRYCSLIAIKY